MNKSVPDLADDKNAKAPGEQKIGMPYSACYAESFARFTVKNRFPRIFNDYCSGNYDSFIGETISSMLNACKGTEYGEYLKAVTEQCLASANASLPKEEQLSKKSTLKDFFYTAPFLEAEVLFYHILLIQKNYFQNGHDFYAISKRDSVINGRGDFIENINKLFRTKPDASGQLDRAEFNHAVYYCLSANTSDLSQLNVRERFAYTVSDIQSLHDDTEQLYSYISDRKRTFRRFDIICDNAGKELFSDVYLACYFLYHDIVNEIVFHVKRFPYFVSDATGDDFGFLVSSLSDETSHGIRKLKEYIREEKIKIEDDLFWTKPLCFKDLKSDNKELYHDLKASDLVIVKGDLNYRRLVEDKKWDYTKPFAQSTAGVFGDAPIFAPRVIKSNVLVGISKAAYHTAKSGDKIGAPADQCFDGNGRWAVIHFRPAGCAPTKKTAWSQSVHPPAQSAHTDTPKTASTAHQDAEEDKNKSLVQQRHLHTLYAWGGGLTFLLAMVLIFLLVVTSLLTTFLPQQIASKNAALFRLQTFMLNLEPDDIKRIDFSLLLTGYGIFLTGAFLVPRYYLEQKAKDEMEKEFSARAPDMIQAEIERQTKEKLKHLHRTEYMLDGDLSRMTAFLLNVSSISIWSVGWCFHSLKRYILAEKEQHSDEVLGFLDLLYNTVIKKSMKAICDKMKNDTDGISKETAQCGAKEKTSEKACQSRFTALMHAEAVTTGESHPELPVLRLIKDATEIEFILAENVYDLDPETEFYKKCNEVARYIGSFIRYLFFNFISYQSDAVDSQNGAQLMFKTKDDLVSKILSLSDFTEGEEPVKNRYRQKLEAAANHIYANGWAIHLEKRPTSSNDFWEAIAGLYSGTSCDTRAAEPAHTATAVEFFFTTDETCYPLKE